MEKNQAAAAISEIVERRADAFRNVLNLTERIEGCLRKGETDAVGSLLDERQLWMDRIDGLNSILNPLPNAKVSPAVKEVPSRTKTEDADCRNRTAELIRSCIEKNLDCAEILRSACGKARETLKGIRPARPASIDYTDARSGIPRFVDVRL